METAPKAIAGELQRKSRDGCRQAHVPGCIRAPPLHHSGERLLRVDQETGRQAALFLQRRRCGVLSFAGLWDRWRDPATGEPTTSCTIIVTDANAITRPIHDRMPVILDKADFAAWLGGTGGTELLRSAADDRLRMWPVSRRVNKTVNGDDDPTLIEEVAA